MTKRVTLICALAWLLGMAPPAAAQRPSAPPTVGFLGMDSRMQAEWLVEFRDGLRALGFEEGRNGRSALRPRRSARDVDDPDRDYRARSDGHGIRPKLRAPGRKRHRRGVPRRGIEHEAAGPTARERATSFARRDPLAQGRKRISLHHEAAPGPCRPWKPRPEGWEFRCSFLKYGNRRTSRKPSRRRSPGVRKGWSSSHLPSSRGIGRQPDGALSSYGVLRRSNSQRRPAGRPSGRAAARI